MKDFSEATDQVARKFGYVDWNDVRKKRTYAQQCGLLHEAAELYARSKEQQWISVKDGLPKQYIPVLVWIKNRKAIVIATAYNSRYGGKIDHWQTHDVGGTTRIEFDDEIVTHWMPLPEYPKK